MNDFELFLNYKRQPLNFSICECGYEKCKPLHSFGPATRDFFLFHFVIKGKGVFRHNNSYSLSRGDVFLVRPGETVYYCADNDEPWTYFWIGFDSPVGNDIVNKIWTKDKSVIHLKNIEKIERIFYEIAKSNYKNKNLELLIVSRLYEILFILYQSMNIEFTESKRDIIDDIIDYLNNSVNERIIINDLAHKFGLSRSNLYLLFKNKMGVSLKRYIIKLKMEKALFMIQNEAHLSLSEIAWFVGYDNYQSFFKEFKKYFNKYPSELR